MNIKACRNMRLTGVIGLGLFLSLSLLPAAQAEPPLNSSTVMVANRGVKIAFHVTPARTPGRGPTIVLDAGGGGDSSYWNELVPELAKRTGARIITYDRAGFGASDERPGPLRLEDAVDDLAQGLKRLGATRNVILVPHSFDANIPNFFTEAALRRADALYAPVIAAMKASKNQTKQTRSQLALFSSFVENARSYHRVSWPKGVKCTVIVSEKTPLEDPADAQMWRDGQAQFSNASKCGLVVAERSSHDVAHDRPDLILQAVAAMAARSR
jgi:pimeloyl-ACP methyl ester carboxylesterase